MNNIYLQIINPFPNIDTVAIRVDPDEAAPKGAASSGFTPLFNIIL